MSCLCLACVLGPGNALLLVARRSQIIGNRINFWPPIISPIVSGMSIVAVDFDNVNKRVYWGDSSDKMIYSSFQNGTDKKQVGDWSSCLGVFLFVYIYIS